MWSSLTGQFDDSEINSLGRLSVGELVSALLNSDSVVVLRVLAELLLHSDFAKLDELLANSKIRAKWASYASDHGVDARDHEYARRLRARRARRS